MTQLVELKQNRDFIEPDFPGYKLSLQEITKTIINLSSNVHIQLPNNEQYTYKHAKLFTLHNHILVSEIDPLEGTEHLYYIGHDHFIYKIKLDILGVEEICTNWKIPIPMEEKQLYNFTLSLPDENLAIASDGAKNIYFLDRRSEWKCVFQESFNFHTIILDSKCKNNVLHVVLFDIVSSEAEHQDDTKHKSVIHWLQYECLDNVWRQICSEKLESFTEMHNVLLSEDLNLYVLSAEGGFVKDSEENSVKSSPSFTWCQDNDSVNVFIKGTSVEVRKQHITVKNKEEVVLDGKLSNSVDASLSTYSKGKYDVLEITLSKDDNIVWKELIDGLPMLGECLPDEKTAKEVHGKLAHLCSEDVVDNFATKHSTLTDQVEECDFISSKGALIERLTPDKAVSHRVILTQEIIFVDSTQQVFAIQQNEDVCLYKPVIGDALVNMEGNSWNLQHFGTLFALGYIRASKQRRKFTTCAPDLSYSIVAEGSRHVFVYRQHVDVTSGELRHRRSGKRVKQLAQQQVIELQKEDIILGVKANNHNLFILTETKMYVFKMCRFEE